VHACLFSLLPAQVLRVEKTVQLRLMLLLSPLSLSSSLPKNMCKYSSSERQKMSSGRWVCPVGASSGCVSVKMNLKGNLSSKHKN
jgi:hypothetical protein